LVQQQQQGTLLPRSPRVVLGAERLAPPGRTGSTAVGERVNLPWRQAVAPLVRQPYRCCQDRESLRPRGVVCQAFYTVARPQMSLRQPLPRPERTCYGAIRPCWCARTPALAAGLTDPVWPFRELLTAKFEPLESQSISQ
jgi:hypothetical protein